MYRTLPVKLLTVVVRVHGWGGWGVGPGVIAFFF